MSKPKKQTYKQSNAAIACTFHNQSSLGFTSELSSTRASTLAATTLPNSAPPSTVDPSDLPALNSWDQQGPTREYSSGPEKNSPITFDDSDLDEGYGSEDYVSEMDSQELRDSLELQMEGEIEQIHNNKLVPSEAEKYIKKLVDKEMPCAMKRHLELELFSHIHMKVGKGVSVSTAH